VYIQGPTRTSCYYCGARWIQQGSEQDRVIARHAPESALRSMRRLHAADPALSTDAHEQMSKPAETRDRVLSRTAPHDEEVAP
jgi:hypothetical protein